MSGPPLPTIPGESAKDYRARLQAWHEDGSRRQHVADVRNCRCGCGFDVAGVLEKLGPIVNELHNGVLNGVRPKGLKGDLRSLATEITTIVTPLREIADWQLRAKP